MFGTIVNTAAIVVGSLLGLLVKSNLSEKMMNTLMKGLGLCTLYLGISGSLKGENSLILIVSMVVGTLIGAGIDLDEKLQRMGFWVERKMKSKTGSDNAIAEGFVTGSLLFCVGAMAIIGSLQSGLTGNNEMIFNKAVLDFVAALILASTLGIGVMLAAACVFFYQGAIVLAAQWLEPLLTTNIINEMTCVGSVIIIGLALNMIGVTKMKIMNFVPAVFLPIILCRFL